MYKNVQNGKGGVTEEPSTLRSNNSTIRRFCVTSNTPGSLLTIDISLHTPLTHHVSLVRREYVVIFVSRRDRRAPVVRVVR